MVFSDILQRFADESPWCVMARGLLESVFSADKMNALFDAHAQTQETRTLLFSSCVDIMSWVVCRVRRSVNASCKHLRKHGALPVSVDAVYDKLARVETQTSAGLVRYSAQQVNAILDELQAKPLVLLEGYDLRIVDGNHPEGTQHRLGILRDQGGGALPGVVVAVLNPQNRLIEDVVLSEDGHAQECVLFEDLLQRLQDRQLWLADRHYCTSAILFGIARQAFFLIRQHAGHLRWQLVGERHYCGRSATGEVYEQTVILTDPQTKDVLIVRRITVELDKPTRDGETQLHILSNVPKLDDAAAGQRGVAALTLATLYLERWQLETAFKTLTVHLRCEPNTLGYPPAALFAFCVAIACYNLVGAMLGAVRAVHGEEEEKKVSSHQVADEMEGTYRGMGIAVPDSDWDIFRVADVATLAQLLKQLVTPMRVEHYYKYPSRPKKHPAKPRPSAPRKHISTHRLLNPHLFEKKLNL